MAAGGCAPTGRRRSGVRGRAGLHTPLGRASHPARDVRRRACRALRDAAGATPRADPFGAQGGPARAAPGDADQPRVDLPARSPLGPAARAGAELAALAGRAQLYIADGHHRYETAVAFAAEDPRADRLLSFIVSRHDPGLTILPTHRIVFGAGRDAAKLIEQWRAWFEVGRVAPCMDRVERLAELGRDRTACIVAFPDDYDVTLVLKPDAALDRVPGMALTPRVSELEEVRQ